MIWRNVLIEIEGVKQPVLPATLLSHHPAALHQCTARSDPLHKRRFSTQRSFSTELTHSRRPQFYKADVCSPTRSLWSRAPGRAGNFEAKCVGSFHVDYQFELRWLLDGKIAGLRAFENLVHIDGGTPEQVDAICP